jgi:Rad3-related DNA helicase
MFHLGDGSGRELRPQQKQALDWLSQNWNRSNVFVINAPVGAGKSLICKAIQLAVSGDIINPNNVLVYQNVESYPGHNYLIGRSHYHCSACGRFPTAEDIHFQYCPECPYPKHKARAIAGEHTFYNPYSLHFAKQNPTFKTKDVAIVDEFHQCIGMLRSLGAHSLEQSKWLFPNEISNDFQLMDWVKTKLAILKQDMEEAQNASKHTIAAHLERRYSQLSKIHASLVHASHNQVFSLEDKNIKGKKTKVLSLQTVTAPKWACQSITGKGKIILLSATVFDSDVKELVGHDNYLTLDLTSPIAKESRPVYFRPLPISLDYTANPDMEVVAAQITKIVNKHPNLNTIVHVSYDWQLKLLPYMPNNTIWHTKENKQEMLDKFKAEGGIFLAAGCAEGIDLKDDLCRVTIIPKLLFPNISDRFVTKRMASLGGWKWYAEQTIKTVCQQVGRSTRSETDWSYTYVLDPRFSNLVNRNRKTIPKSFLESIVWNI